MASTEAKRPARFVTSAVLVLLVIAGLALAAFYSTGGRFFIIQTPSMGDYAPVGTLIASTPTTLDQVQKGDTLLFHPPASEETYFHRVVEVLPEGGLKTQGDINGTIDPWTVEAENIIGKESLNVEAIGFLIRVLPFLIVAGFALQLITRYFLESLYRFPIRVFGWSLLVSIAAYISRPFFNAQLISQTAVDGVSDTTFVATGVFGVQGSAVKGTTAYSNPGELATVTSDYMDKDKLFSVVFSPYLHTIDWIVIVSFVLLPLILCVGYAIRRYRVESKELTEEPVAVTA